jgi:tryptophan-rich sensory protein
MQNTYHWYSQLKKPSWAPPSWVFGPVWSVLYVLIFISFGKVFLGVWQGSLPYIVALPFVLNLIFNFAFSPLEFRLKNNFLAAADVLFVLGTLIWAMVAVFFASQKLMSAGGSNIVWIAYMQIPYLLWVTFATILQLTITYLNK